MVQFLELHVPTAGPVGLIPGRATKILHAVWPHQKNWNLIKMKTQHINLKKLLKKKKQCGLGKWP